MHEQVHVQIFKNYGVETTVILSIFGDGSTEGLTEDLLLLSTEDRRDLDFLNMQTEIIGYPLAVINCALSLIMAVLFWDICYKKISEEDN